MNPKIEAAVEAIKAVYRYAPGGGFLHAVIDDGNLDCLPYDIPAECPHTLKRFSPGMRKRYQACVDALAPLNMDAREYACAIVHGYRVDWLGEYERHNGEVFDDDGDVEW